MFYRAAQEDIYLFDAEDEEEESFTILFLYQEGWETDTSETRKQKQVCYFVLVNVLFKYYNAIKVVLCCMQCVGSVEIQIEI